MKRITYTLILFLALNVNAFSQQSERDNAQFSPPIPVETMIGNNSGMYQMIVFRNIGKSQKFSLFNLTTYEDNYNENAPDYYLIKTIAGYNITRKLNIGLGTNFNPTGGFRPLVAASFMHVSKKVSFIAQPGYELHKDGLVEIFAMFEWSPKNDKKIQPYFRLQAMSSFNSQHGYSYHFWRAGIRHTFFRIGPAVNVQYAGVDASVHTNFGGFINVLLK